MSKVAPPGIQHPALTRVELTNYLVRDPDNLAAAPTFVTTDTLREYCRHAVAIQKRVEKGTPGQLESPPADYTNFARLFNQHAPAGCATFPVWNENDARYQLPERRISWPAFMCNVFPEGRTSTHSHPHSVRPQSTDNSPASTSISPDAQVLNNLVNQTLISETNARAFHNHMASEALAGRGSRGGRGRRGPHFIPSPFYYGPHPYRPKKAKKAKGKATSDDKVTPAASTSGTSASAPNTTIATVPVAAAPPVVATAPTVTPIVAPAVVPAPAPVVVHAPAAPAVIHAPAAPAIPVTLTPLPTAAAILASAVNTPAAAPDDEWTAAGSSYTVSPSDLHSTSADDTLMGDAEVEDPTQAAEYLGWSVDVFESQ